MVADDAAVGSDTGDGWAAILCESPHDDLADGGWGAVVVAAQEELGDDADEVADEHMPEEAIPPLGGEIVPHDGAQQSEYVLANVPEVLTEVRRLSTSNFQGVDDFLLGRCLLQVGILPESTEYRRKPLFDRALLSLAHRLSADTHVRSIKVIAADTGVEARKVVATRTRLGAVSMHLGRHVALQTADSISNNVLVAGGECLTLSLRFRYDETPLRLTTRSSESPGIGGVAADGLPHELRQSMVMADTTSAKLVQIECEQGVLIKFRGHFHFLTVSVPTSLASVDRCTGAVYTRLLADAMPQCDVIGGRFQRCQRLATTDGDKACGLAERAAANGRKQWEHCHSLCDLHRVALVAKRLHRLMPFEMTGIINISLSLKVAGGMRLFRSILRRVLAERVRRLEGRPGPHADWHREAVLNTFCPADPQRPSSMSQRLIVSRLANGNYQNCNEVEHFCEGCCNNEAETIAKFCTVFTRAIAGRHGSQAGRNPQTLGIPPVPMRWHRFPSLSVRA